MHERINDINPGKENWVKKTREHEYLKSVQRTFLKPKNLESLQLLPFASNPIHLVHHHPLSPLPSEAIQNSPPPLHLHYHKQFQPRPLQKPELHQLMPRPIPDTLRVASEWPLKNVRSCDVFPSNPAIASHCTWSDPCLPSSHTSWLPAALPILSLLSVLHASSEGSCLRNFLVVVLTGMFFSETFSWLIISCHSTQIKTELLLTYLKLLL